MRTNISARWETLKNQGRGSVSDLSTGGCFVLSGGEVSARELVRIEMTLDDRIATVWGYVVYNIPEMGFAVRFVLQIEADQLAIDDLIKHAEQRSV